MSTADPARNGSGHGTSGPPEAMSSAPCRAPNRDAKPSVAAQTGADTAPTATLGPLWPLETWSALMSAAMPPALASRGDTATATMVPDLLDRSFHAAIAQATGGFSPAAGAHAITDWWLHLALSPGKQFALAQKAVRKITRLQLHMAECMAHGHVRAPCIEPLEQDKRFADPEWNNLPYAFLSQSFLLTQQWWHNAVTGVPGVSREHERMLDFMTRQVLDTVSPSNSIFTNPVILRRTMSEGGANLARGFQNAMQDLERHGGACPPVGAEKYRPGENVATTPGRVVFRNDLIELIQYAPQTDEVHAEPILITPAWIMKYYILDLEPHNSMVRYLVDQGFTVFMISWRNPGPDQRDLTMNHYLQLGILAALDAISDIVPGRRVHSAGYCLGGTLLAIAAAFMGREGMDRIASVTLLAAQTDFSEPGELQLFINESQLAFLEDLMWEQGFLDSSQMSGAFRMLRSRDLGWSRMVREYLLGERAPMNALMAWNADGTRLPYAMHSEYLRKLYLNNDLATGRYPVDGHAVALADIRPPIFAVGTVTDHVAPWKSVFRITLLAETETTFLLTSGGHNAGIVSEPGHPRRRYQVATRAEGAPHFEADVWARETPTQEGSWWPEWARWLASKSSGRTPPPSMPPASATHGDAPGTYVLMR